jgi:predicted DNA-binding transcriptional regulator YafY
VEGYFLPPVMFSIGEAISLLIGLTSLRRLRAKPFAAELETAEHKLLAAVPEQLRAVLAQAQRLIGFEEAPTDMFVHPELETAPTNELRDTPEDTVITVFLQALLGRRTVTMRYHSPHNPKAQTVEVLPRGLIWDRDRWYLVGPKVEGQGDNRLWRADRVLTIKAGTLFPEPDAQFDVKALLGRQWLGKAMTQWIHEAPVTIRLTPAQAERLKADWYYRQAQYETEPDGRVLMTFGEDKREFVFELLRWLGPGAELVEPKAWRAELRNELEQMLTLHQEG